MIEYPAAKGTSTRAGTLPRWVPVLLAIFWLATGSSWALVRQAGLPDDYDASGGLQIGLPSGADVPPARAAAIAALAQQADGELSIRYNGLTLTPRSLSAARALSGPTPGAPEFVARDFLRQHRAVWGFSQTNIDALELSAAYSDRHSGMSHVFFGQTIGGTRVFIGVIGVHLDGAGRVLSVQGDAWPQLAAPAPATVGPLAAAQLAADSIGVTYDPQVVADDGTQVTLTKGAFRDDVTVSEWIYPLLGVPVRTQRVLLHKNGLEWYDLLVHAETGAVLHRRNLYQFLNGEATPSSPPEAAPAAPRGLVYLEHPLQTVRGTGDLPRAYPLTGDPTGRPRGFANAPLFGAGTTPTNPNGPNAVNATIDQILLPLPGPGSALRSSALPLSTSPQSPSGWFNLVAGQYLTIGNNVDAKDDHADDNEGSIGLRASGGTTGDFSGPAFLYQNFYAQNGPYASEGTLQPASAARKAGAAPDLNPAILTLFYGNNWYHDLLYHLGFDEAAGNFQDNNFGRGGLGGDYVLADAQDGSGTNNANFGTPADGSSPRMQQFLFSSPERDGTMDVDVIIHEYTHGVSNRLVGGPNNVDCLNVTLVGEGGGMGEGWGDWYGAMIADEPAVGEYATGNGNIAIRRFPMDSGPADFTYGRICTGPTGDPTLTPCVVHDIGEFWSINLWEMREAMINRFHNRAFPGGPAFATFSATGSPDGNIKNAQGRTTDGSGDPAMTDFASIERAAFTAMFRVTDGMKLAPCNPTIADMRDAILAADRAAGGEFQDLIWRSFANRGIGTLATSTGGTQAGVPVVVESFDVPATVSACEAAGGPLDAPNFTLSSLAANEVTIDIVDNGAVEYVILRNSVAAGSAIDPAPYVEVGRTGGTTFVDTGVDGVEHFYRVHALRNDDCVSASGIDSIVPLGGTLDCTLPPSFDGLARVLDVGDCANLLLEWGPAVSNCPVSGPGVTFSVYRGETADFTVDNTSRIASGVVGHTFVNAPGQTEQIYFYVVRAEDSTSGHGGPTGGNQESNTKTRSGMVTSGELINQGFSDDVESGADDLTSTHFTSSGRVVPFEDTRGGWYRDSAPAPVAARSGSTVWHTFNPDNSSFSTLTSGALTITPESILTFWHTFQSEAAFDGGVLEVATVNPITGLPGTWEDLGDLIYENGYNGALDAPENTNPLFNRPAFTGGVLGPMQRTRAYLGGLIAPPSTSAQVMIRFLFASDVANLISVPPTTSGTFIPGWYIDDITVDESCCPISAAPTGLSAFASAPNEVSLTWNAPAGGSIDEYRIFRAEGGDTLPASITNLLAVVPGTQTDYVDSDVTPGVTYIYIVRAIPSSGCPSGASNADAATAYGDAPLPRKAPVLDPVADDATPDQTGGVDRDGDYVLSWSYPADGATPCGYRIEEATGLASQFSDDAEEALSLGSNSTWTGDPTWTSDTHPDTGTNGYTPLYLDSQSAALTLASPLVAGAGASLAFDSFEDIEDGFDAAYVEISGDGGAFAARLAMTGTFSGRRQVDLSAYEGQDVLVRFRLVSDEVFSTPQYLGWFIDNIAVEALDFTPIATVPGTQNSLEIGGRGDGTYSYRVTALFGGACDESGPYSNQEEITVALNPDDPLPPSAGTDNVTTPEGMAVVIDVLANDSDPNGDPISVASVTQPANGSAVVGGDDSVTYTPNAGFSGSDTFTYQVCDPGPLCDTGRVFVTVTAVEDPCVVPGVEVNTDAEGDTSATWNPTNDPSLDILSVSLAEPYLGPGVEQVVVTLQVADFATPHPSAAWRVVWTAPDALQYFVSIQNCNAVDGVECNVGTFDGTLYSSTGAAAGCEFTPEGTLTITADKSDVGIDDTTDGGLFLSTIEGHAQVFLGAACSGLLQPADDSGGLNYEIQTNEACGDQCPEDPNKTDPGVCGCGVADTDSDGDGTADCIDDCPADPGKTDPGTCGCGTADTDSDGDGTADCIDDCPADPGKTDPGICGCGTADTDSDGDGTADCNDDCPNDPDKVERGECDCGVPEGTCQPVQGQGRVHGSGFFLALGNDDDDSDSDNLNFSFTADYKKNGELKGKLKLRDRAIDLKIEAATILSLGPGSGSCNGTATGSGGFEFTAAGYFNNQSATFRVCGEDLGNPGNDDDDSDSDSDSDGEARFPDRVYIECLSGCTYNTATRTADDVIDGGNVKVTGPIVAASGGSAKSAHFVGGRSADAKPPGRTSVAGAVTTGELGEALHAANANVHIAQYGLDASPGGGAGELLTMPQSLELDPLLSTDLPAGTPLLLTTTAIAPENISAAGRGATLRWRAADGTRGKVKAVVDALGVAVFPVTVLPGNTVYHVRIGRLGSNRVVISGLDLGL